MGLLSLTCLMLSCYERSHPGECQGRGTVPFSHSFQERRWGGLWGWGSWLSLTPAALYRTPRVFRRGGLLPWWPVCSEFLQGEVGDIYTQGQGESRQAAEGRRAGTVRVQRDHWLRCIGAGGPRRVLLYVSTCVQRQPVSLTRGNGISQPHPGSLRVSPQHGQCRRSTGTGSIHL